MNSQSHNFSSATGVAAVAQAPIAVEMLRLRAAAEEAHSLLDTLEERLSQVLRPVPPHPVGDESKPLHESPLHGALMGQANEVVRANSRIVSMLDRLTL